VIAANLVLCLCVSKVAIDVMHNMLQKHSEGGRARMIGPFQKQVSQSLFVQHRS
jgi:hypothetical protein